MPPVIQQNLVPIVAVIVLLVIFWPQLMRILNPPKKRVMSSPSVPEPPPAPNPIDLVVMGRRAIRDAAEIKGAEKTLDILGEHYARRDMQEMADALQNPTPTPCEFSQAVVRHANAVAPAPTPEPPAPKCPVQ